MRRFIVFLMASVLTVGCTAAAPNAGQEAVIIRKPWLWGNGGVDSTPRKPGREYFAMSTEVVYVNMLPETFHLAVDDMMTADGVPLDFDATIRLRITDSVKVVTSFGTDWYKNNVEQPFRMFIRDAVKKRGMNEVAINSSAAEAVDKEVTDSMVAYLKTKGIPVELEDVTVGKANPPDAVKHQRIATAEQEQRQNTEKQAKLAEDQRKAHEEARAEADKAYLLRMGLSPEQFVQLKQIETLKEVCAWQRGNCTFVNGNASGTLFTIK